jgi:hypothetical protein
VELHCGEVLEEVQSRPVVWQIEDVLGVIARQSFFVDLLADAEQRQMAREVYAEQGFGIGPWVVFVGVPVGGQIPGHGRAEIAIGRPDFDGLGRVCVAYLAVLEVVPDSCLRE